VSPQNSATTTTSRKPAEKARQVSVKLSPPEVARSTRLPNAPPLLSSLELPFPPNSNATSTINGSNTMKPRANWVRRRDACRRISAPIVKVRVGR
jgi:hypothetical protein